MACSRPSSILIQPPLERVISSASSVSSRDFVAKHIRFAPLPEPDNEEHASDGVDTPNHAAEQSDPDPPPELLASSSSSSSSSANSTSLILGQSDPEKSSPGSSAGSSPIILSSKLSSSNSMLDNHSSAPPSSSEPYHKKPHLLLRPFKRFSTSSSGSSSHTLTPTSSIEPTLGGKRSNEEILSLGAVNLFRTASRESSHSASSRWSGLGRNIPPSRSPSTRSSKSISTSRFPIFSSSFSLSSESKPKPKAKPTPLGQQQRNRHKGTVILNGRVYGGSKDANPFANARDEEPEFVEWGYGGMGSIKGAKSAGVSSTWDRLQGGSAMAYDDRSRIVGVGGVGAGIGATDVELDDGSGMAWLKRRKEERERKAREQKEKEEAEKENSESQDNTPIPTRSPTMEAITGVSSIPSSSLSPCPVETATTPLAIDVSSLPIVPEGGEETATKFDFPTPTRPSELVPSLTENGKPEEGETGQLHNTHENERVLQAINVPLRSPRPHHHRRSSSKGTRELSLSTEGPAPQIQVAGSPLLVSPRGDDDDDTTDASTGVLHTSTVTPIEIDKPAFASTSFSSSSGSEDDGDDDDDEEDEDEGQEEELRIRNALGHAAGVEKISRHNKE